MHADAHLKNYSLLLAGSNCVLAPLYDATSWLPYRRGPQGSIRLVLGIGDADTLDGTDRPEAILRAADHFKMPALDVARRFENIAAALPRALQDATETLPAKARNLAIVEQYVAEQHQRARRCHEVAAQAIEQAATARAS